MNKWIFAIFIIILIWILSLISSSILNSNLAIGISDNKIALIQISGTISGSDDLLSSNSNPDKIIDYIKKASDDDKVKGILLEINSPGGTVVASEEIMNEVKKAKEKKPVVAYIRDVGASGAYWIASAADIIVADPMSITGSIGVLGSYLEFSGLLQSYNVTYERLVSGDYKDIGSPFKRLGDREKEILQQKIDLIYNYFIEDVAKNRNMSLEHMRDLANGIFYLGVEAKENGLVDELGGKDLAFNITKKRANITDAVLVYYKEKKGLVDVLSRYLSYSSYYFGRGLSDSIYELRNKAVEIRT